MACGDSEEVVKQQWYRSTLTVVAHRREVLVELGDRFDPVP
jgi:hypothetical protein